MKIVIIFTLFASLNAGASPICTANYNADMRIRDTDARCQIAYNLAGNSCNLCAGTNEMSFHQCLFSIKQSLIECCAFHGGSKTCDEVAHSAD